MLVFMLTVHLQHSHVPVHYPKWLSLLVLSPQLHQIHHSSLPRHLDKNFAEHWAFWDWMFGTLYLPRQREDLASPGHDADRSGWCVVRITHPGHGR